MTPVDALASRTSVLEVVRAFLASSATPRDAGAPAGCLAVDAAVEHGDTDPEVSRRLEEGRRLERASHVALLAARDDGELAPGVGPQATAAALVSLSTGLKVLSRAGADQHDRITTTVDATMAMLARTDPT